MKYIFVIICSIILPVFSLNEITPKFCINCKFFTNSFMTNSVYGKCCLFPKTERNIEFFVNGVEKNIEYYYCSTARDINDMCGKEGKRYISNISKN